MFTCIFSRSQSMAKRLYAAAVVVLTYFACQSSHVAAQSFTNCALAPNDPDITVCKWSVSPLELSDSFTTFVLDKSSLITVCNTGGPFTTANCGCEIYVGDGTGVFDDDNYCNSCTLLSLSVTSFSIYWDCSNRATGNCVKLDANGCQTGNVPTPFPVLSPIDVPTEPVESFTNCALTPNNPDITVCEWSVSPLVLSDSFTTFVLDDSTLYTFCNTGGPFTTSNCGCEIYIDDGSGVFDVDNYCNSCTLLSLSVTESTIYWDCSNRATGNCVKVDANGCSTGNVLTPFPVNSPTDFPTNPPELFTNCELALNDPDFTVCEWSAAPLTLSDSFTTFVLDKSSLITVCNTGGPFTTANCSCDIYVDDGTGVFDDDNYCNSCTLLSLSVTSFSIYWDCSNRATGNCVKGDENGCHAGNVPTPFPVESPIDVPTEPPESFINCRVAQNDPDVSFCKWSVSPLVLSDTFTTFVLENSSLFTVCDTGGNFTTANCGCEIYIGDGTGVFDEDNYCNSCTLLDLSVTNFSIYWDCSNRANGNCVKIDENGCSTGNVPIAFPVKSPANLPTNPPEFGAPHDNNQTSQAPLVASMSVEEPTAVPSNFSAPTIQSANSSSTTETEISSSTTTSSGGNSRHRYYNNYSHAFGMTLSVYSVLMLVLRI